MLAEMDPSPDLAETDDWWRRTHVIGELQPAGELSERGGGRQGGRAAAATWGEARDSEQVQ